MGQNLGEMSHPGLSGYKAPGAKIPFGEDSGVPGQPC